MLKTKLKLSTNSRNLPQVIKGDKIVFNRCVNILKPGEVYEVVNVENAEKTIEFNSVIYVSGAFGECSIPGYDLVYARIVEFEQAN